MNYVKPGDLGMTSRCPSTFLLWVCALSTLLQGGTASTPAPNDLCEVKPVDPNQNFCINRYRCHHGDCVRDQSGFPINCVCHRGWLQPECNRCCDKPCQNGGTCEGTFTGVQHLMYCRCPQTHRGDLCEEELCLLDCGDNGVCTFMEGRQRCQCLSGFFGDNCDQEVWYWASIYTVVAVGVILLLLAGLMPYLMWRQRALIVLKIHYFFQRFKDDESLRFDAFISCTSYLGKDVDFVRETLCPHLESTMGYRVCYGERNFTPGEPNVDNICRAVEQSRRTILLLTPDYVADTWPVFQLQMAQMESLQSAHRIIPIIYKELGPIEHPTLRNILRSLQCIKWPKKANEKTLKTFYEKLAVLMPKPKSSSMSSRNEYELVL